MGVGEQTRERVETCLSALEERYGSFPVNQATVPLSTDAYERRRETSVQECVTTFASIRNEDGDVLYVDESEQFVLPSTRTGPEGRLEGNLREAVRESTGVTASIDDVARAFIHGLNDENGSDRAPVYRLVVVFTGARETGSSNEGVVWRPPPRDPRLAGVPVR